ncbi:Hermansky-Pudlak syndrome 4 protein homolog [Orbicella faveolata]|uniref:Hermansky-Pudlak syndrome 4 protein homolog n=1 Tax=Orbicella faveolata TaxID=48498 RepID=UPI0009E20575|nr:Hermansky-Pudlak syndrome 4 protein homolog [Orbicella faveolata]
MTALIAPTRSPSFEGLIFFVYDREAVKKEADPPENAIIYFYPPSASMEDRISICGQLIGVSHFMHGFIGARPALCKLQTEKVATVHSGQYTLALGGNLSEPDSLLIRQLETLQSIFKFYHGSLERIRMVSLFDTWVWIKNYCILRVNNYYMSDSCHTS